MGIWPSLVAGAVVLVGVARWFGSRRNESQKPQEVKAPRSTQAAREPNAAPDSRKAGISPTPVWIDQDELAVSAEAKGVDGVDQRGSTRLPRVGSPADPLDDPLTDAPQVGRGCSDSHEAREIEGTCEPIAGDEHVDHGRLDEEAGARAPLLPSIEDSASNAPADEFTSDRTPAQSEVGRADVDGESGAVAAAQLEIDDTAHTSTTIDCDQADAASHEAGEIAFEGTCESLDRDKHVDHGTVDEEARPAVPPSIEHSASNATADEFTSDRSPERSEVGPADVDGGRAAGAPAEFEIDDTAHISTTIDSNQTDAAHRLAPCPRCGVVCAAEDEERIFGFRTMRSTNAHGLETSFIRRQSYCRQCRVEHAAIMRGRRAPIATDPAGGAAPAVAVLAIPPGAPPEHQQDALQVRSNALKIEELTVEPSADTLTDQDEAAAQAPETLANGSAVESLPGDTPSGPSPEARRSAPHYQPPSARRPSLPRAQRKTRGPVSLPTQRATAMADVRILFDRHGGCSISLLPRRPGGWPETVCVSIGATSFELQPLQEGWYDDVQPEDIGEALRDGVVLSDPDHSREWLLTGRDVFTLAGGSVRGFLSCSRLEIDREHVVLCRSCRLPEVEAALGEAGCADWTTHTGDGVPRDWAVLRHVVPRRAVPQREASDILNILRPALDIDIQLEGGVRIDHNSWLLGRPPTVRIYGSHDHVQDVVIDGQPAVRNSAGELQAPRITDEGEHEIWCSGVTKRFSIVSKPLPSTLWTAHRFDATWGEAFTFCGPLVRHVANGRRGEEGEKVSAVLIAPSSHPVLIGANPGEIQVARSRSGRSGTHSAGADFQPTWGLPLTPLLADKRRDSVRLLATDLASAAPSAQSPSDSRRSAQAVLRWCSYLLDASRKGLPIEQASPAVVTLWREYLDRAHDLRRRLR